MIRDFLEKILLQYYDESTGKLNILDKEFIELSKVDDLNMQIQILESALEKRIKAIKIMEYRLKKDQDLLAKMNNVMAAQNRQLHEQMNLINDQRKKLKHIEQIDWRMNKLKMEQKRLVRYTQK